MTTLLDYVPLLICPIVMGIMMWSMSRSHRRDSDAALCDERPVVNLAERQAALSAQRVALEAEIAALSKIVEQNKEREGLYQQPAQLTHASR